MNYIFQPNFKTTRRGMMRKLKVTSGRSQENSFTVITLNPESSFTRREKNHSQFHHDVLTWPELQVRPWVWCWGAALTIIGIPKGTEIYPMRGRVSHDSSYWTKNLQMSTHGPEEASDKEANNKEARSPVARNMENCVRRSSTQRKTKVGIEKPQLHNARKLRGRSEGFHAREKQKVPVRAIVEGDLFRSARSSFFFLFFLLLSPRIVP